MCLGETFAALVKRLQGALWELGGVPRVVRTDNLSMVVDVRLHSDHIEMYYRNHLVKRMERVSDAGEAQIDYRHIMGSLVRLTYVQSGHNFCFVRSFHFCALPGIMLLSSTLVMRALCPCIRSERQPGREGCLTPLRRIGHQYAPRQVTDDAPLTPAPDWPI